MDREPRQRPHRRWPRQSSYKTHLLLPSPLRRQNLPPRLHHRLRRRPRQRHRLRPPPQHHPQTSRRSPRRSRRPLLAAHRGKVSPLVTNSQPLHRRHLPLHDLRLGRQDPHGLLQPLRHGLNHRQQSQVRRSLRRRHRPRPSRHRHPHHRPPQPEPLSRRLHPVPLHKSPRVVGKSRHWQNSRLIQHHRPRSQRPQPPHVRSAGRFQMVCRRADRRHPRLRRRRISRRHLPPPQRPRLDHRQRRPHPRPTRRRNDRPHRRGSRPD